jgi:hypothetical protein
MESFWEVLSRNWATALCLAILLGTVGYVSLTTG